VRVAIVVPVLNEDALVLRQALVQVNTADEVFIIDGGSALANVDITRDLCQEYGANFLQAPRGRASQMNAGAKHSTADWLLFLHADVGLPSDWRQQLESCLNSASPRSRWGRFDVEFRITQSAFISQVFWQSAMATVAGFMNLRSRLTSVSTGDQAQFIERNALIEMGGFPTLPLMEDIALSKRASKQFGAPLNLRIRVSVSARRWEKHGFWRTVFLMWKLRWQYWRGADPERLHKAYYG
jgi:rSAM/selenodomain-associated transferase 2